MQRFFAVVFSVSGPIISRQEPVFVKVYGAQESIPRNRLRQPMLPDGPVRQIGLSYGPARLGIDSWTP
jgi:hypothetical protein